ncbi:MAG TPA: adenosylmethionine decarboxylase [Candidatus Methylomirabilis sp.]
MQALGKHLLVELHGCDPEALKSIDLIREAMVSAAKVANATIVGVSFHEFSPFGISGVVVIAESHLSIHTWPEYRYAAVDIFTCGDQLRPEVAADYIALKLKCKNPSVVEVRRGLIGKNVRRFSHKVGASEGKTEHAYKELSLAY